MSGAPTIGRLGGPATTVAIRSVDMVDAYLHGTTNAFPVERSSPVRMTGADAHVPAGAGRHTPELVDPDFQGGQSYTGHAFNQMQNRGLTPPIVKNTIRTGNRFF